MAVTSFPRASSARPVVPMRRETVRVPFLEQERWTTGLRWSHVTQCGIGDGDPPGPSEPGLTVTARRIEGWSAAGLLPALTQPFDRQIDHYAALTEYSGQGIDADVTSSAWRPTTSIVSDFAPLYSGTSTSPSRSLCLTSSLDRTRQRTPR